MSKSEKRKDELKLYEEIIVIDSDAMPSGVMYIMNKKPKMQETFYVQEDKKETKLLMPSSVARMTLAE